MGLDVGWLTLGSGIASGADVILIPEIPYHIEKVSEAILERNKAGKMFSIVAVAEGANSAELVAFIKRSLKINQQKKSQAEECEDERFSQLKKNYTGQTHLLANRLEQATGIESRITILGHLLRGGAPSASDRILATHLGTRTADLVEEGVFGKMVAFQDGKAVCVPLADVIQASKQVPMDHPWITGARHVGTVLGD